MSISVAEYESEAGRRWLTFSGCGRTGEDEGTASFVFEQERKRSLSKVESSDAAFHSSSASTTS